jgi:hypothetical protein
MARKQNLKSVDNDQTTLQDNETLENVQNTPDTGQSDPTKANSPDTGVISGDYIDSDSANIADSLTKILSVPTETIQSDATSAESKESVLRGYEVPDQNEPVNPNFKSQGLPKGNYSEDFDDFSNMGGGGDDESSYFEDNELLAQIGVELIDMMMTYGAMAIARDWDNEEKYAIKDKRKKKLEAPLQKILENREVKTAPELVFAFMLVVSYSPIMIEAVQVRRQKAKESKSGAVPAMAGEVRKPIKQRDEDWGGYSVEPQPSEEVETPDDEDAMADMISKMKPKRKPGRPVGATDLSTRVTLDEEEREKQVQKAKALRKDGWAFSRIAKELNVSQATATRWIRS